MRKSHVAQPDSANNASHVRRNFTNHVNEPVLQSPLLVMPNGWPLDLVLDRQTIPRSSTSVSTRDSMFKRCTSEKRKLDHVIKRNAPSMITSNVLLCEKRMRFSQWKRIQRGSGGASFLSVVKRTFKKLSARGEKTISKHDTPAIFLNQRSAFRVKLPEIASEDDALACDITARQSTNWVTVNSVNAKPNFFNVLENCCTDCKYLKTVEAPNAFNNLSRCASANCDCCRAW